MQERLSEEDFPPGATQVPERVPLGVLMLQVVPAALPLQAAKASAGGRG